MNQYEIHHEVGINAKPEVIYKALTNVEDLAKWWTSDTRGSADLNGVIEFWFNSHVKKFKVNKLINNELVSWKALDGDGVQWGNDQIQFNLSIKREKTFLHFTHSGWTSNDGAYAHCSTKWAVFMLSLKDLIENSAGRPFPKDTQVN